MANEPKNMVAALSRKCVELSRTPSRCSEGSAMMHAVSRMIHARMMRFVSGFFSRSFPTVIAMRITPMTDNATSVPPSVNMPSSVWL